MNTLFQFVKKLLLCTFLFAVFSINGSSQEGSCAEKLRMAQNLFVKGQIQQVPELLNQCLNSGFSREEALAAFKLIIQSYMFEENQQKSDSTMLEFLKKYPEYQLSQTDHSSFVYLYNNYQVRSVVKIALHIGTNIPFLTGIAPGNVSAEPSGDSYKSELINLYASLEGKFELGKNLEINIESAYSQLSFTNRRDIFWDNQKIGVTSYTETQRRIEIPLSVTYDFKKYNKLVLYGRVGMGPALSMGVSATAEYKPTDKNVPLHTGPDVDRKASRISLDLFGQAGAGLKYKIRGGFLFTELRTNIGFFNQIIRDGLAPEVQELGRFYYYEDDSFHLNAVNFNVGYTHIFYKPSKLK